MNEREQLLERALEALRLLRDTYRSPYNAERVRVAWDAIGAVLRDTAAMTTGAPHSPPADGERLTDGRHAADDAWLSTVGMFSGDEAMREISEETRRVRESQRTQTDEERLMDERAASVPKEPDL